MPQPEPPPWTAALPPLLAGLSMLSLAAVERNPEAAAEGRYLALAATTILIAAAGVARRPLSPTALALPVLTVVAFAAAPPEGPARGAAMGVLLCLGPGALLVDGLLARRADLLAPPGSLDPARLLRLGVTLVAALIGLNLLLRQGELLDGSTFRLLVVLVAVPATAAVLLVALFARMGAPALAGTAALVLAAGGVRSNVVLALVTAVLADAAARALEVRWPKAAATAGIGLVLILGLVLAREPAFGVLLAAMAAAVVWRRFGFAVVLVLAGALTLFLPPASAAPWPRILAGLPLLLLAGPHLIGRGNLHTVAAAVLLAVAGLRFLPPPQALLAAIALWTVLCTQRPDAGSADDPPPVGLWRRLGLRGDAAVLGFCWQGGLLVFATLSATYPWLRPAHLEDRLRALELDTGIERWLALAALVLVAHGVATLTRRAPAPRAIAMAVAGVLLTSAALAAWGAFEPRQTLLSSPRQVLTRDHPRWVAESGGCGRLVLDTAVTHGGGVAAGRTVASVTTESPRNPGDPVEQLRHGDHTGEWSARASGSSGGVKPWLYWVAAGDPPFFGTRYRTAIDLDPLCGHGNLVVVRDPELPDEVEVIVFHALHIGRTDP